MNGIDTFTGDGIELCREAGADTGGEVNIHFCPLIRRAAVHQVGALMVHPAALLVSADGQRLMDESKQFDQVLDLVNQKPRKTCYALYDTPALRRIWAEKAHVPEGSAARFYEGIPFDTPFETREKVFAGDFR